MPKTSQQDDWVQHAEALEAAKALSSATMSTAPLTPPAVHDNSNSDKQEYNKNVPTSASTLSTAPSLEIQQDDERPPDEPTCSSPYDAFLFSSEWLGSRSQLQLPDMISRSSSRGAPGDDETDSVASGAYFDPKDFDTKNWYRARIDGPAFGFAMVALATALVHPVLFVAGALTAFGALHAAGAGYEYCTRNGGKEESSAEETAASWENKMLSICLKDAPEEPLTDEEEEEEGEAADLEEPIQAAVANNSLLLPEANVEVTPTQPADNNATQQEGTVEGAETKETHQTQKLSKALVERAYPPLDNTVVKDVSFPGLHAIEFFRVFFADDAPYNFQDLQKQRGDLDIVYGKWQALGQEPVSLQTDKKTKKPRPSLLEDWKSSFQGRVLSFRAKTNNFIGPVYATTQKTQRVLLHHKTMIVMESRTDLSDIPFADRFYVLERWIIRAEKVRDETGTGKSKYKYVSTLNATSQVVFTQSCQFASQIKTKSASTIQDLVKCWCTMAKEALKLTEQCKILRLKHEQEGDSEAECYDTDLEEEHHDATKENTPPTDEEEGIEVTWPGKDAPKELEAMAVRHKLRHSGSAPLPAYRGRALQSLRRSVSSLWNNRR